MSKDKISRILKDNFIDMLDEALLIIDKEYNVIKSNSVFQKNFPSPAAGSKCYNLIGRDVPCQICTCSLSSKKMTLQEKEEKLNGKNYVVSSKVLFKSSLPEHVYIESYRDITYSRTLEASLVAKNNLLKNNLDIAKLVQHSLLPKPVHTDSMDLSYVYIPCEELGGDFFDLYRIDEYNYGLYLADVSGHGVSAAMLTMFLNASIDTREHSPAVVLNSLYTEFNKNNFLKNQYITIFLSVFNVLTRSYTYCNAGLNSTPVIYDPVSRTSELIEASGFPISNWVDDPGYSDNMIYIKSGHKVFFYTDGITEAKNRSGIPYGFDRLIGSLLEGNPSTNITLDRITSYLEDFIDNDISSLKDDITLLLLDLF